MRRIRAFLLRLYGLSRRASQERELNDELESLIALHTEDNIRAGMASGEARRQAILKFGSIESTKLECRDQLRIPFLETFLFDVLYAIRSLARSPIFTAVVVASLALGIGSTTLMFNVVESIVRPPLPYSDPDRLVSISDVDRLTPSSGANVASGDFVDWQRMNTVFSGMAAYGGIDERGGVRLNLYVTGTGEARLLKGLVVNANLFDVLGVAPMRGRSFGAGDHVAILSYACWQAQFAADPQIVGRSITVSGEPREVIGVMPRGFFFPTREVDAYIPSGDIRPDRLFHDLGVVARLRPGVSFEEARAQMAAIGATLSRTHPETNANLSPLVESWPAMLSHSRRPALLMMFAAVAVLFLIVCSNIAHLQLGRGASRMQEFSVRKALGAGRGRLIGQLLAENLVLSLAGGILGLLFASVAGTLVARVVPEAIPLYADLHGGTRVVFFDIVITLVAPLLFGIGPALSATSSDGLRDRAGSSPNSHRRTRDVLVSAEVALSVVLVVCAGLLVRSFVRLESVDLGFRPEHTLSFRLDLGDLVASEAQRARQISDIERSLLDQRGIEAAGATARPVLGGGSGGEAPMTIQGREQAVRMEIVTPGYFQVMRTQLLSGRFPGRIDTGSALSTVVNSAFERAYFPDKNALGKQIVLGRRGSATIIGVVSDLKQEALDRPAQPAVFVSSKQIVPRAVTFVVRGPAERSALAAAARRAVHSVNGILPLTDVATLNELVQASVSGQRIRAALLFLVAGAALILAALGIYGVLAYSVVQRSAEIGIRLALGAPARRVFSLVVLDGMRPVMTGAVLGFTGAYAASRLLRSSLFGIVPEDPPTYLLTVIILAAVALCACAVPARRALRIDPVLALRRS